MNDQHHLPNGHSGWDYRCCGIEAQEVRLMTDKEYRSVKRPALLWMLAVLLAVGLLAFPKLDDPFANSVLDAMKGLGLFFGLFALWLTVVFGRCALHKTVMVFHGKPIVKDQFLLAGHSCQSPLKLSKEPVTIRVFWPVCLVLVDSDLWEPHPWFRRWPYSVKLVAIARGETEFSGCWKLNGRERWELAKHAVGAFLKIILIGWCVTYFTISFNRLFGEFGADQVVRFTNSHMSQVFLIAIACQFFWIYRAFLMLIDCLWGRVYRYPGSDFSWLRISRAAWHRDGKPANWREKPGLLTYPPSALSRYARENLSYHKRGIGDERPA